MSTCAVCLKDFPGEDAPILMIDPSGNPLVLCPECAALVEAIAGTPDTEERRAAVSALAEIDVENPLVANELSRLVTYEDAPLSVADAWEDEEEMAEEETPVPETVTPASNLYLYLGLGCLGLALILFLILRLI